MYGLKPVPCNEGLHPSKAACGGVFPQPVKDHALHSAWSLQRSKLTRCKYRECALRQESLDKWQHTDRRKF